MPIIQAGNLKVGSGQKRWGQILVREGKKQVRIPLAIINGASAGEHVVVMANQHGGEINGIEAVREAVDAIAPRRFKGTLFAIPSANPRAAMLMNECWPENEDESLIAKYRDCPYLGPGGDRHNCLYNMNRKWPGKKGGLLVERMTYEIWNRLVMTPHRKTSLLMDLHCHTGTSAIYAKAPPDIDLGVASGLRMVIHTRSGKVKRHYCHEACAAAGISSIAMELGGQRVFDPESIAEGKRAILNMLKFWGMLPGRPDYPKKTYIMDPWAHDIEPRLYPKPTWKPYKARHDGLVRLNGLHLFHKYPYRKVRRNELIATILDPFSGKVVEECCAPMAGVILSMQIKSPVCHKGDDVFAVAVMKIVNPAQYTRGLRAENYRD